MWTGARVRMDMAGWVVGGAGSGSVGVWPMMMMIVLTGGDGIGDVV
jgi:hypothetical protein